MPAKIAVLDDSAFVLNATRVVLEEAGYSVATCAVPHQFFTLLETDRPDLALVDVSMPGLEGDAVVWVAQSHHFHACPIVLFSAKPEHELEKLARSCGADGYICKTEDEKKLLAEIARFLKP